MTGVEATTALSAVANQYGFNAALVVVLLGGAFWLVRQILGVVKANTEAMGQVATSLASISANVVESTRHTAELRTSVDSLRREVAVLSERVGPQRGRVAA